MQKIIRKLDSSGDSVLTFDPEVTTDEQRTATQEAKALFERLTVGEKSHVAFDTSAGPEAKAPRIDKFEELGSETILIPRLVGG